MSITNTMDQCQTLTMHQQNEGSDALTLIFIILLLILTFISTLCEKNTY